MSFLKKFLNSTSTRLICLEFLFLTFAALPALADKCSEADRVPLPGCVKAEYFEGGVDLNNFCNHVITIKVDIADGLDQRVNVGANGGKTTVATNARFKLNCCPKYNKCT
jgi:hypothetical protein